MRSYLMHEPIMVRLTETTNDVDSLASTGYQRRRTHTRTRIGFGQRRSHPVAQTSLQPGRHSNRPVAAMHTPFLGAISCPWALQPGRVMRPRCVLSRAVRCKRDTTVRVPGWEHIYTLHLCMFYVQRSGWMLRRPGGEHPGTQLHVLLLLLQVNKRMLLLQWPITV